MSFFRSFLAFALCTALTGCVPAPLRQPAPASLPAMRWDHRPEAAEWTRQNLAAIARHDAVLAGAVPTDVQAWCPGYAANSLEERRAFWSGMMSAVAEYESMWNPQAVGGGGRWIGLMQISPRSAKNHGCAQTSAGALKDGATNLECAVQILAYQVARDGQVAGKGNRGIGRDWMPLRKASQRAEVSEWTRSQSYCQ